MQRPNHTSGKRLAYWRNQSKVFANPGRPPVKRGSYHHQWRSLIRLIFRDQEQHHLLLTEIAKDLEAALGERPLPSIDESAETCER
jgi:hypothetical protein